jgi:hypothetical protein
LESGYPETSNSKGEREQTFIDVWLRYFIMPSIRNNVEMMKLRLTTSIELGTYALKY